MWTVAALLVLMFGMMGYGELKERVMSKKEEKKIYRLSNPTNHDQLPFGTELRVIIEKNTVELFKQVSMDDEKPCWHSMGIVHEASHTKTLLSE